MKTLIKNSWKNILKDEFEKDYFKKLEAFIDEQYATSTIYPPKEDIFNALNFTDYENVKVVILGQDPYHGPNQAHGLSFSVKDQGVLLLNTVLTVRAGEANSHKKKGWEIFTDEIIKILNNKEKSIVFILWGNNAISKKQLITNPKHYIIESVHPSPLSASRGFFGSKPFSKCNNYLKESNQTPIDWENV